MQACACEPFLLQTNYNTVPSASRGTSEPDGGNWARPPNDETGDISIDFCSNLLYNPPVAASL